ncbi:putative glycolipid-binding domain-containing protein [Myxococcus sp. SDU36]|uniref:putative glycolipid-binding domain-containing protein n=1 Tax=Myxococcus sp. SDU36 TaxID=2831967 RepID=UPI002543D85D|nr:putative glycolipid-binding domain-containing protein [Myxococcus sp. SDU36]WIG93500.1 putative glycolipid-binding domain-containing protein [Myxococcus sp. SDU36]
MDVDVSRRGPRALVWRRLLSPGSEYFELRARPEGWELAGSVVFVDNGLPHFVEYTVTTNAAWETQAVHVLRRSGEGEARLQLRVDAERCWWKGDEEVVHLRGCSDIDVACTPSTNTLPIRRLGLEVGQAADVRAAWLRIPSLALEVLPQRYTRLTQTRYRYESNAGRFVAEVDVDAHGLVTNYPPGWERIAVTRD